MITKEIDLQVENENKKQEFQLFAYEKLALQEKQKQIKDSDVEYWEIEERLMFVNACLDQGSYEPKITDPKELARIAKIKLEKLNNAIETEKNEPQKCRLRKKRILFGCNDEEYIDVQIDLLEQLKKQEKKLTGLDRAIIRREIYHTQQFIWAKTNKKDFSPKQKLETINQLLVIEKDILVFLIKSQIKDSQKPYLSKIKSIESNLAVIKQRTYVNQIKSDIETLKLRGKLYKPRVLGLEYIFKEGNKKVDQAKEYLGFLQDEFNWYKNSKPKTAMKLHNKYFRLTQLFKEIEAKEEYIENYKIRYMNLGKK